MRQVVGDGFRSVVERSEAGRMRAHEAYDALDSGTFPTRRDVDQHERAERTELRLRDEAEQAAHRCADQHRFALLARDEDEIVDEVREVVMAVVAPRAVAVASRIGDDGLP